MNDILHKIRKDYFTTLANKQRDNLQFIILIHMVSDIVELIDALSLLGDIAVIIAIPYSADKNIIKQLAHHPIAQPTLDELLTPEKLNTLALKHSDTSKETIILEIGGYFAKGLTTLHQAFQGNLLGVIEDTEAGHRRYEAEASHLPCPVYSVARSVLKESEDVLIGRSCIYATETILRKTGHVLNGQQSLVLGYGKIGRGVARTLKQQNAPVMVYDIDPKKRILALTEGYQVPSKISALHNANFIFGATGNTSITLDDFPEIRNGAVLISCSSKKIEFDLDGLYSTYQKKEVTDHVDSYHKEQQHLYLVGDGQPVNFVSDKCLVGPVISLIQGEMLMAAIELITHKASCELHEVAEESKDYLSNLWLDHFCDKDAGSYKYV
jgi:adenosylhomocysteinase